MKVKVLVSALALVSIGMALIFIFGQKEVPLAVVENHASIKFMKTSYDFGVIREADGNVEHSFEFINNGTSDLLVIDVRSRPVDVQLLNGPGSL